MKPIDGTAQDHAQEAIKWTMLATRGLVENAVEPEIAIQIAQVEALLAVYVKLCEVERYPSASQTGSDAVPPVGIIGWVLGRMIYATRVFTDWL